MLGSFGDHLCFKQHLSYLVFATTGFNPSYQQSYSPIMTCSWSVSQHFNIFALHAVGSSEDPLLGAEEETEYQKEKMWSWRRNITKKMENKDNRWCYIPDEVETAQTNNLKHQKLIWRKRTAMCLCTLFCFFNLISFRDHSTTATTSGAKFWNIKLLIWNELQETIKDMLVPKTEPWQKKYNTNGTDRAISDH